MFSPHAGPSGAYSPDGTMGYMMDGQQMMHRPPGDPAFHNQYAHYPAEYYGHHLWGRSRNTNNNASFLFTVCLIVWLTWPNFIKWEIVIKIHTYTLFFTNYLLVILNNWLALLITNKFVFWLWRQWSSVDFALERALSLFRFMVLFFKRTLFFILFLTSVFTKMFKGFRWIHYFDR